MTAALGDRRMTQVIIMVSVLMSSAATFAQTSRPLVGAIRWDAWTGGGVTEQVERTLGPKKYHGRLPGFAEVIDYKTVMAVGRWSWTGRSSLQRTRDWTTGLS